MRCACPWLRVLWLERQSPQGSLEGAAAVDHHFTRRGRPLEWCFPALGETAAIAPLLNWLGLATARLVYLAGQGRGLSSIYSAAMRPRLLFCVQLWDSPYKKKDEQSVQLRVTMMMQLLLRRD